MMDVLQQQRVQPRPPPEHEVQPQ
ncbi:hypothetical protein A2U01_0114668, partial [Trifolium medium]|nr:hypothetical protein [Trifolium medium]